MVTITKETTVTSGPDQSGEIPMIDDVNWPFFVNAPGTAVSIRGLHFVRPKTGAIWIYAVRGLSITDCRIDGLQATMLVGNDFQDFLSSMTGIFGGYRGPEHRDRQPSNRRPG